MRILLSNDDGYMASGLAYLAEALSSLAHIDVVAPERDRSGASNSLTLDRPLRVHQAANGFWYVDGTPTDCVHLAITGLLSQQPDMVVAGINHGANLGDDVLYSGTVAAAMEGRFLGIPAIAVSLVGRDGRHYDTATTMVRQLIKRLQGASLPSDVILNVNVPDIPYASVQGVSVTRLGHRHQAEPVVRAQDPYGRQVYWIGPPGPEADADEGTDFFALRQHHISITPIHVDLTRHTAIDQVAAWLSKNE